MVFILCEALSSTECQKVDVGWQEVKRELCLRTVQGEGLALLLKSVTLQGVIFLKKARFGGLLGGEFRQKKKNGKVMLGDAVIFIFFL